MPSAAPPASAPARRPSWVSLVEGSALVAFLALCVALVISRATAPPMVALDPAALAAGPAAERWYGIFFQDQHVGWSLSRVSPMPDGGQLFEQRSSFRVATFGKLQEVVTAGAALVDPAGALQRFDFFMAADAVQLIARGEVRGQSIEMDVIQAGETSRLSFPVSRPPQVGLSLEARIAKEPLAVGHRFTVPYFDPVSMAEGEMEMIVTDVEIIEGGEEAWWIRSSFGGMETRALIASDGSALRQESGLGLASVRMSAEAAQAVPSGGEPVDLISLSAVRLDGVLTEPRALRALQLQITGVESERVPIDAPRQRREGDALQIEVIDEAELPDGAPLFPDPATAPLALQPALVATATLPAAHPELQEQAARVVEGAADRKAAARALLDWVYKNVDKEPSVGVPNGLEVLRRMRGDCNEHTALYVSLARAAGVPARIAAGVVYSDRIGGGAFYYHAWPEVAIGPDDRFVPLDPTFGQWMADATHIKLVEGDLDRQVEIMGFLGRLGFSLRGAEAGQPTPQP
jgi:hypothetical protein